MKRLNTILIVDDSDATNQVVATILGNMDIAHSIVTKTSVEAAIEYLSDTPEQMTLPDLIFLDIEIGERSGFDFLNAYVKLDRARANNFYPRICMVSNHINKGSNHDLSKRYAEFGVVEQLKKPLDPEDVMELISENEAHFK